MEAAAIQHRFRAHRDPLHSVSLALGGSQACVTARCSRVCACALAERVHQEPVGAALRAILFAVKLKIIRW
jgi:hypothetical protein